MAQLPYLAVIVDLDRTLLRTDKTVSDYTLEVLQAWREAGAFLLAATARPERAITEYRDLIGFHSATTLNGARTVTPDSVYENTIDTEDAVSILEQLLRQEGAVISVEAENGIYANSDIPVWHPAVIDDIGELPRREKIYKILASHPGIPADQINVNLPNDTYASVADQKLVQIMSTSATKWNGIQKMLESYGIAPDQAICFGDDNDDLEPIRRCGCGVAVSNALECVRDAADYITQSNDEDGVAGFLTGLFSDNLNRL